MKSLQLFVPLLIVSFASPVFAQKDSGNGPVGIFQSQDEYFEFIGGAKEVAYGPNGSPEMRAMIPMLNDIALNRPMGWTANRYGDSQSTIGLLSDANVRAELEMVDEQYQQLQDLNSNIQKRAANQLRSIDFKNSTDWVEQVRGIRKQANADLNAVLLPHQVERLQQIRMQSQLRRRSLVDLLTSDPLKTELEISDRQSDELRQEEKQIEEDLAKEIAKLREKARDRLLSKLKPHQKAEVKGMLGDKFEFVENEEKPGKRKRK